MSGKRERPRDMEIDEHTLQYKKKDNEGNASNKATPEEIAARKIYKISKTPANTQDPSNNKPKFTFAPSTQNSEKKENDNADKKVAEAKPQSEVKPQSKANPQNGENNQEKPRTSIFGDVFKPGTTTFSFGESGLGMFSNSHLGEGLFSKKSSDSNQGSLFQNKGSFPSTNSSNIFNFSQVTPPIKKQNNEANQEGDEADSAELEKEQIAQIDPSKSTGTYQYSNDCEILFKNKANKIKKHNGEVVENVEVIVQKDKDKMHIWFSVRLFATKTGILNGLVVKSATQVKNINGKDQNVCVSVLVPPKEKDQKFQKHTLKLQFEEESIGKELITLISEMIKE